MFRKERLIMRQAIRSGIVAGICCCGTGYGEAGFIADGTRLIVR